MSKLFIIIGDGGLNGPWLDEVSTKPWTLEHLHAEDVKRRMDGSSGTMQGFMQYEIDTETHEIREIDFT